MLQQPDTIKRMSDAGLYAETSASPDEFRALVKSDIDRLGKVIKDAGVTPQ